MICSECEFWDDELAKEYKCNGGVENNCFFKGTSYCNMTKVDMERIKRALRIANKAKDTEIQRLKERVAELEKDIRLYLDACQTYEREIIPFEKNQAVKQFAEELKETFKVFQSVSVSQFEIIVNECLKQRGIE